MKNKNIAKKIDTPGVLAIIRYSRGIFIFGERFEKIFKLDFSSEISTRFYVFGFLACAINIIAGTAQINDQNDHTIKSL